MYETLHPDESVLNEYLDGELAQDQRADLELHLARCPGCSERLEEILTLFLALDELPHLSLERDLAPGILAGIASARSWETKTSPALRLVLAAQFSLALVLLFFAWPIVMRRLPVDAAIWFSQRAAAAVLHSMDTWAMGWDAFQVSVQASLGGITEAWRGLVGRPFWMRISLLEMVILLAATTALWLAGNGLLLGGRRSKNHTTDLKRRNP